MKVSLNWLKKYTKIDLTVDELVAKIGAQLGAVEEVIDLRGKYDGIKIVRITEAKPHPNADRLNIYQASDGTEVVQVVSGDRSLNVGDKVAWIAPGQTIPATHGSATPAVMAAKDMRGEMSHGMFASGRELDMNDDHEGVLKLDADTKPGMLLAKAYELDDVIIDIENKMFTHRPDCFGLIGVAREIAGIQGKKFVSPAWYLLEAGKFLKPDTEVLPLQIKNDIPNLVPEYHAAVIAGVTIGPSPLHMQAYLRRVGIRPLSNVVDATNYLMYLTGQPLHAFDYDKVAKVDGHKTANLTVRLPQKDEKLTLLDGRTIKPYKGAVLICSRKKPIALGGVMGGAETEIDSSTKNIIIEAATFDMFAIRKTSMEHGIFTDAVTRYSKGQSPQQASVVLAEVVDLVRALAGGRLACELGIEAPKPQLSLGVSAAFINERLGSRLRAGQMRQLLENVEMAVSVKGENLRITPPFWRTDLEIAEDIVEEIGRLFGYGKLHQSLPQRNTSPAPQQSIEQLKSAVSKLLAAAGNNQLQTYSFVSAKLFDKTGQDTKPVYRLRNALSPELQFIRTSLLPSLLEKVHANHKAGFEHFGLFELGQSHNKQEIGQDELPRTRLGLSYIISTDQKAAKDKIGAPFYDAKKQLSHLLESLRVQKVTYQPLSGAKPSQWWLKNLAQLFEPKRAALVLAGDVPLGLVGEFKASLRRASKLPDHIAGFELDLGAINGLARPTSTYQPLLRFPATEQDLCFKVAQDTPYDLIEKLIWQHFSADERLRAEVQPVDIFQHATDHEHKQMTYRLRLQHYDRTLTTDEVTAFVAEIADKAHKACGAQKV